MKIRPLGAELFHADGRTDMTKVIVAFRNFANAPTINGPQMPSTFHSRNKEFCVATRLRTQRHMNYGRFSNRNQTFVVQTPRLALGPKSPPLLWPLSYSFLEINLPKREANNSSRSRVEVKNMWKRNLIPSIHLQDVMFH